MLEKNYEGWKKIVKKLYHIIDNDDDKINLYQMQLPHQCEVFGCDVLQCEIFKRYFCDSNITYHDCNPSFD